MLEISMTWNKHFIGVVLFSLGFLTVYLVTRDAVRSVKCLCWRMRNDKENISMPEAQETKIIINNTFVKAFQETFSGIMKDKCTKSEANFRTNIAVSNKTFEEIDKTEKYNKFRALDIHSHDIKFMHKLPMLIHFIWINNDIRTRNNYDKKTDENLKTFSIYEKTGWKIILWDNRKVYNIFCTDTKKNEELCQILTNVTLAKQYKITLSMKSDMLRFVIMHEFGGMYFDTDYIALRNMDHIIRYRIKEHGLIVVHEINERRSMYLAGESLLLIQETSAFKMQRNMFLWQLKEKNHHMSELDLISLKRLLFQHTLTLLTLILCQYLSLI